MRVDQFLHRLRYGQSLQPLVVISPSRLPMASTRSASRTRAASFEVDAYTDIARIERMAVVECILKAKATAHGQLPSLGIKTAKHRTLSAVQPDCHQR